MRSERERKKENTKKGWRTDHEATPGPLCPVLFCHNAPVSRAWASIYPSLFFAKAPRDCRIHGGKGVLGRFTLTLCFLFPNLLSRFALDLLFSVLLFSLAFTA